MEIKCPNCKCIVVEDADRCKDQRYLSCPYCNAVFLNKYYFDKEYGS